MVHSILKGLDEATSTIGDDLFQIASLDKNPLLEATSYKDGASLKYDIFLHGNNSPRYAPLKITLFRDVEERVFSFEDAIVKDKSLEDFMLLDTSHEETSNENLTLADLDIQLIKSDSGESKCFKD